tara:strand:- start:2411 stop:3160 length:750 start_codon:yes stop_codon:yes gene_type:complete
MKDTNKTKINRITDEITSLTTKLISLKQQLEIVNDDYIGWAVECCEQKWDSKKLLEKHKTTMKCRALNGAKCFNCPRCNRQFFDGYSSLKELLNNPIKLLDSDYKKHVEAGCATGCSNCGQPFNTQYMFKNHKCATRSTQDEYSYTPEKKTWDIWRVDGINYDHNINTDKVYKYSKYVGYIEDKLLHFDDPNSDLDLTSDSETATEDTKDNCLIDDKEIVITNQISDDMPDIKKKKTKFIVKKKPMVIL